MFAPGVTHVRTSRLVRLLLHAGRAALLTTLAASAAPVFQLPTANHFIYQPGQAGNFYVGTVGKPWTSGMFGCVRTEGWQMHEGLDIRCLQRDKKGEPTDPILAAADGTVAYINKRSGLSNYGNYVILRHAVEGFELYTLYAHLHHVEPSLAVGAAVRTGEVIATMGRTSNTKQAISKERAHLHFEINFLLNDQFAAWHQKTFPGQRNDHGKFNGRNLIAVDPARIFLAQDQQKAGFSFVNAVKHETELCRVWVRQKSFPWAERHPQLRRANPIADQEGIAGWELALNFNGLPFELIPRAASELPGKQKYGIVSVNAAEYHANPCRRLLVLKGKKFELGSNGMHLLNLLLHE